MAVNTNTLAYTTEQMKLPRTTTALFLFSHRQTDELGHELCTRIGLFSRIKWNVSCLSVVKRLLWMVGRIVGGRSQCWRSASMLEMNDFSQLKSSPTAIMILKSRQNLTIGGSNDWFCESVSLSVHIFVCLFVCVSIPASSSVCLHVWIRHICVPFLIRVFFARACSVLCQPTQPTDTIHQHKTHTPFPPFFFPSRLVLDPHKSQTHKSQTHHGILSILQ